MCNQIDKPRMDDMYPYSTEDRLYVAPMGLVAHPVDLCYSSGEQESEQATLC